MADILTATLVMSGTCAVLAVLLLIAERYLVNYGTCTIDINGGDRKLEIKGGRTLLASLMAEGIFIPSACGGRGTCAYCKLKVTAGGGPVVPTEVPLLSQEEIADDVRLSCQVKVRNDVAIGVPEELFLVREYTGVVEKITDLTHDMKGLRIRLVEPDTIEFETGRYIQLETPAYGDNPEAVYRAYSIASPPSEQHAIELIIRLVPEGICTTWVFTILKEGDGVRFNGPYGKFGLTDTEREMVWIAGGSGLAPFRGMIRHLKEKKIARKCTFFFGALAKRDLFLVDELHALEKEMKNFRFIPALSEPADDDHWDGETGLITEVVDRNTDDLSEAECYLCGSGGMIKASIKVLEAKGAKKERIYYDAFT
ncbi:MAG TPA: 2Fe-2S iron-sulfur cluster binding domain-containing protein [Planctomycetota bacterium]|nr:2Fe-2S iron-sulfur cluster binding domain-containing protein [Planctomycetota bacterium]